MKASLIAIATLAATTPSPAQTPGLTGTLVVTNKTPSTATIIDVASKRILATIPTGNGPHEVVISSDGRLAVVSDYSGQPGRTLTVIDVPALRVARTIDLGQYNRPHGMVFLPGDSIVIVTSEASGNVVLVNVVAGAIVRAIATRGPRSTWSALLPTSRAYTGNMQSNPFRRSISALVRSQRVGRSSILPRRSMSRPTGRKCGSAATRRRRSASSTSRRARRRLSPRA
jgi:DNA-binding beta-propeller fold protein YncE